jgi:quinol monooxygenase YgiN
MAATVHVVGRFTAKAGHETALKAVLLALVPPTRRELGCYQHDLLFSPTDSRDFCFVERWENDKSFDKHLETGHLKQALAQAESLVETPPEIRRYHLV